MSNFKIGEKVVCVEQGETMDGKYSVLLNEIYEVSVPNHQTLGFDTICIKGQPVSWCSERFRKLDTQFTEDVCAELIRQVKEEELILTN